LMNRALRPVKSGAVSASVMPRRSSAPQTATRHRRDWSSRRAICAFCPITGD